MKIVRENPVKDMNRTMVIRLIYKSPGITRAALAKKIGLTNASISKITGSLLEKNVIRETGYVTGERGRRAIGLEVNTDKVKVLAVKLSRRELAVGVFNLGSNIICYEHEKLEEYIKSQEIIDLIKDQILFYIEKYPDIAAVSIAVPGPFDVVDNTILGITEMSEFKHLDFNEVVDLAIKQPIYMIHDANAGAMSEWLLNEKYYASKKTLAYYLAGEGIGAGVISNGELLLGNRGFAAEIGHISIDFTGPLCRCGNRGCLELYCSSINLVKKAKLMLYKYPYSALHSINDFTYMDIFQLAETGDELAVRLTRQAGYFLGLGAVNIINAYNPDEIIIGSDLASGGEILLSELKKVVKERTFNDFKPETVIRFEDKSIDKILLGAASLAIDNCLNDEELLY